MVCKIHYNLRLNNYYQLHKLLMRKIPSKYILETVVILVDQCQVRLLEPSYHGNQEGNKSERGSAYLALKLLLQIHHLEDLVHHKRYGWLDVHPLKL